MQPSIIAIKMEGIIMVQFDWQIVETAEYSHDTEPSFVTLTTRSYLTITGHAPNRTRDPEFQAKADVVKAVAAKISKGPGAGIMIDRYRSYRPYPLQAVWSGGDTIDDRHDFKLWVKQPLFVKSEYAKQALTQLNLGELGDQVAFENLAEGTEIQSFSATPLTNSSQAVQTLTDAVSELGLDQLHQDSHREVYIDGYGPDVAALLRFEIDPAVGKIDAGRMAVN